jgi:hypothetical protein
MQTKIIQLYKDGSNKITEILEVRKSVIPDTIAITVKFRGVDLIDSDCKILVTSELAKSLVSQLKTVL